MLADRLLHHLLSFSLKDVQLPEGVGVLDPFHGEHADEVRRIVTLFHRNYFNDDRERVLMLGINPGRFGAGLTGIAFTDPNDVRDVLGIAHTLPKARPETSSQFFAQLVRAAGGAELFYHDCYVHSVVPFGFTATGKKGYEASAGSHEVDPAATIPQGPRGRETLRRSEGKEVNLNYYHRKDLQAAVRPFAVQWLNALVAAGCRADVALCFGKGENFKFLKSLGVFREVVALEHPRYIMQYKRKEVDRYVADILRLVQQAARN